MVENKPGAGGMLGADIVAKARGDTHIVMMSSAASHGIGPVLYKDVPYDPLADFTHIHLVGTFPSVLAVNATSPITSVKQLVDMARAKPGEITYGSGGNGTMNHLTGQLAGARGRRAADPHSISRLGAGDERSLGRPDRGADGKPADGDRLLHLRAHAAAGRERDRALAVAAGTPTFREAGFPDVVTTNWFGFSTAGRHSARARQALGSRNRREPCKAPRSKGSSTVSASGRARWVRKPTRP